jgi:MFS superfamily sulfate permease-like transporter
MALRGYNWPPSWRALFCWPLGLLRVGAIIKYIPRPVIIGFTSGIATIIWVGQWKEFFGAKARRQLAAVS